MRQLAPVRLTGKHVGRCFPVGLIALLVSPIISWYIRKKALAMIHGSGVLVTADQLPEIHACATTFKKRLGIDRDVSVYIVEAKVVNAF